MGSLSRSGNSYSGFATATDGEPDTSWADYIDWFVVITDQNDQDNDGIPDLSDPVEESTPAPPLNLDGWNWYKWPLGIQPDDERLVLLSLKQCLEQ